MRILLVSDTRIRLDGGGGPLTIEAESPEMGYSPFHMLASSLATCVYSVLRSWAEHAKLRGNDLAIEVEWQFAEAPYRVGSLHTRLVWPSLPEARRAAAQRAVSLCTVHKTLEHPPQLTAEVGA